MAYRKRNCTELNPGVHAPKNKCLIYHYVIYFFSLRMFYKYERFWKGSMYVNYKLILFINGKNQILKVAT